MFDLARQTGGSPRILGAWVFIHDTGRIHIHANGGLRPSGFAP